MVLRPTQGMKNGSPPVTNSYVPINCSEWKRHPPLCHPDRSAAKWRDLQFSRPFLEMFFRPERSPAERSAVSFIFA
jgi:hypothetical protein